MREIEPNGDRISDVATPDGRSRQNEKRPMSLRNEMN